VLTISLIYKSGLSCHVPRHDTRISQGLVPDSSVKFLIYLINENCAL